MQIRFRYIIEDRDRHGNVRIYVRLPGRRKVRIRAPFGTDKFIADYNAAISEHVSAPRQAGAAKTGSFRHVCVLYYASATFKRLDPATQSWRRRALDSMCEKHADKALALMEARHVRALRDERCDRPGAANTRLKALKALFAWACEEKPDLLIDMGTLTGAARVALGPDLPPFYTNDETLAEDVAAHAKRENDPLWRMPLWPPYDSWLNSKTADINNAPSGGFAGSITCALFLQRFVTDAKSWLHVDIYGWTPSAKPARPEGGECQAARAIYKLLSERYG